MGGPLPFSDYRMKAQKFQLFYLFTIFVVTAMRMLDEVEMCEMWLQVDRSTDTAAVQNK